MSLTTTQTNRTFIIGPTSRPQIHIYAKKYFQYMHVWARAYITLSFTYIYHYSAAPQSREHPCPVQWKRKLRGWPKRKGGRGWRESEDLSRGRRWGRSFSTIPIPSANPSLAVTGKLWAGSYGQVTLLRGPARLRYISQAAVWFLSPDLAWWQQGRMARWTLATSFLSWNPAERIFYCYLILDLLISGLWTNVHNDVTSISLSKKSRIVFFCEML